MLRPKVIDADGHIYENHEEIEKYFEGKHRGMRRARAYALFPSLDGWPRGLGAWPRARNHIDGAGFQGRRNGAEAIAAYGNDPANPASRSGDNRRKLKTKRSEVIEALKASIEGLEYTLNEREDNSGIISK